MSRRPQRERKQPERFGQFASKRAAEEVAEEEEAPRRQARRRRLLHAEDDEERVVSDGKSDGEEGDEHEVSEEEQEQQPEQKRRGAAQRGGGGSKRAPSAALPAHVPQPPAEPRSCSDVQSLLFACPALIDALLEADGLRTISLVARDAASLAAALCARTADVAGLWHQLARRCNPAFTAGGTTTEALAVVRRVCKADPARTERVNKSAALKDFRLTEKDLSGLTYTNQHNPIFWNAAPQKMYSKLEVMAIAHHKHGSAASLQAVRLAAQSKTAKTKAARSQNEEQRREEMEAALEEAGLKGLASWHYRKDKKMQAFIKRGTGTAAGAAAALKEQEDVEERKGERTRQLQQRLAKEGLGSQISLPSAQRYIEGMGKQQGLEEVVAEAQEAHKVQRARDQRRERMNTLLAAEGIESDSAYSYGVAGLYAYVRSGTGSEEAVVAAAKALHSANQAREQRTVRMRELLAEEGLEGHMYSRAVQDYVSTGAGSKEAAVETVRQAQQAKQQADEACAQRAARMNELLAEEGLHAQRQLSAVRMYIASGEGSEEAAVAAARRAQQAGQVILQRRTRMTQLLSAEGMVLSYLVHQVGSLRQYVHSGAGSEEEALEAARQVNQLQSEREVRHALVTALLKEEGMHLSTWKNKLDGMNAYLQHGLGCPRELVAQAQAARDA